jgi:predicted metal-binding membrane protein
MVVAMMVPSTMPLIRAFQRVSEAQARPRIPAWCFTDGVFGRLDTISTSRLRRGLAYVSPTARQRFDHAAGNLAWMLILRAFMVFEKKLAWGAKISRPFDLAPINLRT